MYLKMMYAGENTMVVEDALSRINSIIERKPLEQTADKKHPADTSITFENVFVSVTVIIGVIII